MTENVPDERPSGAATPDAAAPAPQPLPPAPPPRRRRETGGPAGVRDILRSWVRIGLAGETPRVDARTVASERAKVAEEVAEPVDWAFVMLATICVLLSLYTLYIAREVVLPILLATLLALMLSPLVSGLSWAGIPQGVGAALVLIAILGSALGAAYALSGPAAEWVERMPSAFDDLGRRLDAAKGPFAKIQTAIEKISAVAAKISAGAASQPQVVVREQGHIGSLILSGTAKVLLGAGITVVLLYFLLASGDAFLRKLVNVLPRFRSKKQAVEIARQTQRDIAHYLLTVSLINVGLAVATSAAMYVTGMPNPMLWGAMAGILNFMPFLGHVLSAVVIAVAALLSFPSVGAAMIPVLLFLAIIFLEGNVVTPALLARRLDLNPVAVLVTLILFGWMWGMLGLLLAVPALAVFKIFCSHIDSLEPVARFLGPLDD